MESFKSELYINSLQRNKYDNKLFSQNKAKIIQRNPIFAPILEEPLISNIQELNSSSIPVGNINNSSFESSLNAVNIVDYKTMNKFRPTLNLSCLPPVFEIPKVQSSLKNNLNLLNITNNQNNNTNNSIYNEQNNIKLMIGSKYNLNPIINNQNKNIFNNTTGGNYISYNTNTISLPPINNHTDYNKTKIMKNQNKENNFHNFNTNNAYNIRNYQQKKKLKPIQKIAGYNKNSYNNIHEIKRTIDNSNNTKDTNKIKYFYNFTNKNIIKNEKLKEERILRNKEMSNISLNQNKNYIDKNIVILNNKVSNSPKKININDTIFNGNINDYVSISRNKLKVINIQTLKIYDVFNIQLNNYSSYETYIKNCIKMIRGLLPIKNIIENNDKYNYHVIIESSKDGTLGNVVKSFGSINENIIRFISKKILILIERYNRIFNYRISDVEEQLYNYLDMDYICFHGQNTILLYPGKLKINQKNNHNIINFLKKLYNLQDNIINEKKDDTTQLNIDLMNYGITLINVNIYSLNISVNDLFELISTESIKEYCCLYHYFSKNVKLFSNYFDSLKENSEISDNYIDFLHNLTSFNINNNNYDTTVKHSFLNNIQDNNNNNLTNLTEIIKTGKMYDFANEYYTSNANILSFDLICNNIKKKLLSRSGSLFENNINDIKTLLAINNIDINELCKELRVNLEELKDKLFVDYDTFLRNNH